MKVSTSMSSMNSSTLSSLELEESKVLDKFENSEKSTISTFMWELVKRGSMFKQKKIQKALFPQP
jgi:hypothetical protein